jgi:hypothetical protein
MHIQVVTTKSYSVASLSHNPISLFTSFLLLVFFTHNPPFELESNSVDFGWGLKVAWSASVDESISGGLACSSTFLSSSTFLRGFTLLALILELDPDLSEAYDDPGIVSVITGTGPNSSICSGVENDSSVSFRRVLGIPEAAIQSPRSELDPDFEESTEDPGVGFFCVGVGLLLSALFLLLTTSHQHNNTTNMQGRTHVALSVKTEYTLFNSLCNTTNLS